MIVHDPASHAFMAELERLAPSEATILITGETGTGKELVARHAHSQSQRRDKQFVAVNCGALVDTLIEAELFGHEKGAFTGADKTQIGWFEAASGGTLLLDEIGDLSPMLQIKLLRVLQERVITRLGSRVSIPVDVRVLAATNANLREAVAGGRFREDLLFRLNVTSVNIPPLRSRPGDIMPLAAHFLALYCDRLSRPGLAFSPEVGRLLQAYRWPGNIRELENVIYNAVLLASGPRIESGDLRLDRIAVTAPSAPATVEEELLPLLERAMVNGEPELFRRMSQLMVRTAFNIAAGNQARAAQHLGLSRNAFRTQLGHFGIIPPRPPRTR